MMMWGGPGPWWPLLIVMPLLMVAAGVTVMVVMVRGRNGSGPFWGPGGHGSRREQKRDRDLERVFFLDDEIGRLAAMPVRPRRHPGVPAIRRRTISQELHRHTPQSRTDRPVTNPEPPNRYKI